MPLFATSHFYCETELRGFFNQDVTAEIRQHAALKCKLVIYFQKYVLFTWDTLCAHISPTYCLLP